MSRGCRRVGLTLDPMGPTFTSVVVRWSVCPCSSPSHPDLKLWRLPWKQEEGPGLRGEAALCYVSSEHCYPKPDASWEKTEDGDKQDVAVKEEHNTKEVGTGSSF